RLDCRAGLAQIAGIGLLGQACQLHGGVFGKDQQLRALLGGGAHPDTQLADEIVPAIVPVDRIGCRSDLHGVLLPVPGARIVQPTWLRSALGSAAAARCSARRGDVNLKARAPPATGPARTGPQAPTEPATPAPSTGT